MPTKDEALKMAIEALDKEPQSMEDFEAKEKAINACKEALEQPPPKVEPFDVWAGTKPQLAQEPVLYIDQSGLDGHATWAQPNACQDTDIALYTHPHQWQGLTDDEIYKMADEAYINVELIQGKGIVFDRLKFYRAIEQALKEKNGRV